MKKNVLALLLIFSVVTVLGEAVFPADGVAEKRKRILNYLRSLPEKSEGKLLSGQQCEAWPKIGKTGLNDLSKVYGKTGRWPAIGGFDYCEMKGSNTDPALFKPPRWREVNPYIKEWAAKGGLVTISAHMPNPWTGSNAWDRTDCARFADLRRADAPARKAYWRMVRGIADGLEDLQDAKVVVLWRPFHELEGEWFWWGGEGADCERVLILKELWREMHRYMTDRRGLRNLIWVFNGNACHYPGDEVVDLNSADIYGNNVGERISRLIPHLKANDIKPFALAEFGPFGAGWKPDRTEKYDYSVFADEVLSAAPNCVYFLAWSGPWSLWHNDNADKLLSHSSVVSLEELRSATMPSAYTPEVVSRPQLRGVMSPAREMKEDDFKTLHAWGVTLLRYQMVRDWHGTNANQDIDEFGRWLDRRLDHFDSFVLPMANKYGIMAVLDLHVPPGGRDSARDMNMFYEEKYANSFIETWRRIASRFKGRKGIYGYDLINEPVQTRTALPGIDYVGLQCKAAEAVRSEDPVTPIIIEANNWDAPDAFHNLSPVRLMNVIYQVHMYAPLEFTHQNVGKTQQRPVAYPNAEKGWNAHFLRETVKPVLDFQKKHGVRIYVGEFSAVCWAPGAEKYLADCIALFEEYGWDWCYHSFREWPGWSVEHEGEDANSFRDSLDNPRKRVLLKGMCPNRNKTGTVPGFPPSGFAAASSSVVEKTPAAKWDFERSDGLSMKRCSICNEPGRGKCLQLVSSTSRATARTTAKLPDVAFPKTPYTLAIWLKPDKSVISDADVEMAKLGGRRMTKFASAMHDGKWHHLAVTYDPARTNAEYAAYVDWPDEKSPWRFMSFYEKDTGMSKCILPFSFGDGKTVFGGKVGMSLFSVGYSGMIDDVAVYNRALTDDEVRDMAAVVPE